MTGNSDGTKISQRKRCEPAKKNKVRGQKHRCMPNCASIQSHRVSIVVYLNLSTMWHPDTKVLSILPEYSGKWLLIVKGLSNWVFALKSAGLKIIPFNTYRHPWKGSNPTQAFLFVKANTWDIWHIKQKMCSSWTMLITPVSFCQWFK